MMTNIQEKAAIAVAAIRTLLLGENGCIVRHYTEMKRKTYCDTAAFGEMKNFLKVFVGRIQRLPLH